MSNAIDLVQAVQVSDQVGTYRRIVTGTDENGKSYIVSDSKRGGLARSDSFLRFLSGTSGAVMPPI
ncbi:hypothetical protein [Burkholderia gladioli]|uniref:hypothetical protein n=1 Tax=Burkholderia gladioli TaxID=28095 RepID=UPI00164095C6|nr:hypothetical protein [Burkholderia gladioli]